jgi:plasmid maintenance system antidote protein VapI
MISASRRGTAFGRLLAEELDRQQMRQTKLAGSVSRSPQYINALISGTKRASPEWVDLVADTLQLTDTDRQRMHEAAALDRGYRLDLTKTSGST